MDRIGSIDPPIKPVHLPVHVQWLSGQGSGVWFCIDTTSSNNEFLIKRYTPSGALDCERIMIIEEASVEFDINKSYQFSHVSHCSKCRISQNGTVFVFNYIKA